MRFAPDGNIENHLNWYTEMPTHECTQERFSKKFESDLFKTASAFNCIDGL